MTRTKKRKRQQRYTVARIIDAIEKTASTAVKIYRAVEPIAQAAQAIVRRKTK